MALLFLFLSLLLAASNAYISVLQTINPGPFPRDSLYASPGVDSDIWIFGGGFKNYSSQRPGNEKGTYPCYDDVWRLKIRDNGQSEWFEISTTGQKPSCRTLGGAALLIDYSENAYMAVFGGSEEHGEFSFSLPNVVPRHDSLYLLNLQTHVWTNASGLINHQGCRNGPIVSSIDGKLYAFGGIDTSSFQVFGDLRVFDVNTMEWTILHDGAGVTHKFSGVGGLVKKNGNDYFMTSMGQNLAGLFIDTSLFSLSTGVWEDGTPLSISDNIQFGRAWAAFGTSLSKTKLRVYGGDDRTNDTKCSKFEGDATTKNDLWNYGTNQKKFEKYTPQPEDIMVGLKHSTGVTIQGKIYFIGGFTCNGEVQEPFNGVLVADI